MNKTWIPLLAAGLLTTGCQTYQAQSQTSKVRRTEDQRIQQENQRRMAGRIETLEIEIARLSRELDMLRQTLDSRCSSLERKTEDDKREMVNRLTAQVEKLLKQAAPPPARAQAPAPSSGGSTHGFEHVVQPGETLSAIADAYGVTTKVIIRENKIKNPNILSVGQKLFIPE